MLDVGAIQPNNTAIFTEVIQSWVHPIELNWFVAIHFHSASSVPMTGLKTSDHIGFKAIQAAIQARWGGRPTVRLEDPLTTPVLFYPSLSIATAMSIPSSSPERESSGGALPQLECPSSPPGMDPDPLSTGSPVLSPDSSSHDAVLSAPAASPADSENLSPDELELLAKLEEQNRWVNQKH